MEAENVFSENVEYLKSAYEDLNKLEKMKKALETLKLDDRRLQREMELKDKSIAEEIESTLRQRKTEITDTYDKELENNREMIKRLKSKRDKKKSKKISERVEAETADIKEENRSLTTQMKTLFKQNRVPSFCGSDLYYALFMTKGITEALKLLVSFLFCFGAIPTGICFLGSKTFLSDIKMTNLYYAIIFMGTTIFWFFIYILLTNYTKVKHRDELLEGRHIKDKIKANNKKIKAITNAIAKDKDESAYGLDDFDKKLADLEAEADKIGSDKQAALTVFENETKKIITEEINGRRSTELEVLKKAYKENENKYSLGEAAIQEMNILISNKYETYLGKEFIRLDKLQDLISIMEEGDADTVSAAIAFYKS